MPESIADLIEACGGVTAVAQHFDLPVSTVGSWKSRGRIPDDFRPGMIELALKRGVEGVTYESVTKMHAKPLAKVEAEAGAPA